MINHNVHYFKDGFEWIPHHRMEVVLVVI
jgi:hypothetical protein